MQQIVMILLSESSGRGPERGKFSKVVRRGSKRSFGPRKQKSSKSHHPNKALHWCNAILRRCKAFFLPGPKRPFPNHFWEFTIFGPLPEPLDCNHDQNMRSKCCYTGQGRFTMRATNKMESSSRHYPHSYDVLNQKQSMTCDFRWARWPTAQTRPSWLGSSRVSWLCKVI